MAGDGAPLKAHSEFQFAMTTQDREDLRWYLEDYLQLRLDKPTASIAARIEGRLSHIGSDLFERLFEGNRDAQGLWARLQDRLADLRVEISTDVAEASTIPWELLRDPKTDTLLALRAQSFVRTQPQAAVQPKLPKIDDGRVRILLVICRPGEDEDVPFRSVASRLLKSLDEAGWEAFQLDVLRPPTFEQLARRLREAKKEGKPYHIVHFDGHGDHRDGVPGRLLLSKARKGAHGYLVFENPKVEENVQYVDGPKLGQLLYETNVAVLDLNACRSAHAEAPTSPLASAGGDDPHAQVRAFGSLAQEVMDQGVAGVVAMRYNVYVVTAAQFVADLYSELAAGQTLGEAVSGARKNLAEQPLREIAYEQRPLQDWCVPVVYEAAPIGLVPPKSAEPKLAITVFGAAATPQRGALDEKLPKPPDVGFFGRDETLQALDRAFDNHHVVLLHEYAGCGKTATASEFARWYWLTGGIDGPVLFSSFERYRPLARALDQLGACFGPMLEKSGVNWLALSDPERRNVALQILQQVPVLWIWDNVEPVAGFPTGTESQWKPEEQNELVDFLRAAKGSKAKFLLTSRRDEQHWLGKDLPRRIRIPPMPMQERVQLARALSERYGKRLTEVEDWMPLLKFSKGNPMTITSVVGQALRDGLTTAGQIKDFEAKLRAGEAKIADDVTQGRDKSLAASLGYGFENAFNENERKQLALLHLFQGFVDVDALRVMGDPKTEWCLDEVRGLTREHGIALLDRAAEIGLLTGHGGVHYSIHPALPWYFNSLFAEHYPDAPDGKDTPALRAKRAFVEAMGALSNHYHSEYEAGKRQVVAVLAAEEDNLLYARRLARRHGWWDTVVWAMQGLRQLYGHTGRRVVWKRLVDEILPDFIDPVTDGPLLGLESSWKLVTNYRVRLLREGTEWEQAERLQSLHVNWCRGDASPLLTQPPATWNESDRNSIRWLAVSLHELAELRRAMLREDCVDIYEEAFDLAEKINDLGGMASCAGSLGNAYISVPQMRNLRKAEKWYRRNLTLVVELGDRLVQGRTWTQLGTVMLLRFYDAHKVGTPQNELFDLLRRAAEHYHSALEFIPSEAIPDLAVTHHQLGIIYGRVGDRDRALHHARESIRLEEEQGNMYGAAQSRYNVALELQNAGRFEDALDYARAALEGYEQFGAGAAAVSEETRKLIVVIEVGMREQTKGKG